VGLLYNVGLPFIYNTQPSSQQSISNPGYWLAPVNGRLRESPLQASLINHAQASRLPTQPTRNRLPANGYNYMAASKFYVKQSLTSIN